MAARARRGRGRPHDSYTWNLVHLVAAVTGVLPVVVEHDEVTADEVLAHSHVLLSPGPGHPDDPRDFAVGARGASRGARPVLGVCLGMQGTGDDVRRHRRPGRAAHGEVALVSHDGRGVLAGLPDPFAAVRYHSLAALVVPDCLEVTASADGVVMGCGTATCRWRACSSTPSRSCPSTGPCSWPTSWGWHDDRSGRLFRSVAAANPRCFWLDGGGAREWSGRRSMVGWLEDDDVSLSWSATTGAGDPARRRRAEVVGDDVFAVLGGRAGRGSPTDHWVGYFRYACRTDLPATVGADVPGALPDAVDAAAGGPVRAPRRRREFRRPADRTRGGTTISLSSRSDFVGRPTNSAARPRLTRSRRPPTPPLSDRVQEHLHAGNTYEVNLTYRVEVESQPTR